MARRRRRRFSEVKHDPTKVQAAVYRGRGRLAPARKFKIDVQIYREPMRGGFSAWACIPKGTVRGGYSPRGLPVGLKRSPRCGGAHGSSPTKALRGALAKLTRATR